MTGSLDDENLQKYSSRETGNIGLEDLVHQSEISLTGAAHG